MLFMFWFILKKLKLISDPIYIAVMIKSNEKQFIRFENKILFDDLLQSRVALLKSTHVSLKKIKIQII